MQKVMIDNSLQYQVCQITEASQMSKRAFTASKTLKVRVKRRGVGLKVNLSYQ